MKSILKSADSLYGINKLGLGPNAIPLTTTNSSGGGTDGGQMIQPTNTPPEIPKIIRKFRGI